MSYLKGRTCWVCACLLPTLLIAGCEVLGLSSDESSTCGPMKEAVFGIDELGQQFGGGYSNTDTFTREDDGQRVIRYSIRIDDVCPFEHIDAGYSIALRTDKSTGEMAEFTARGLVEWAFLFEYEFPKNTSESTLYTTHWGEDDVGLMAAFAPAPGWYSVVLEVRFPTKGSETADGNHLIQNFNGLELRTSWKEFKPPPATPHPGVLAMADL